MSYIHALSLLMLLAQAHGVKHRERGEGGGGGSAGLLFLLIVGVGVSSPILVVTAKDLVFQAQNDRLTYILLSAEPPLAYVSHSRLLLHCTAGMDVFFCRDVLLGWIGG